MQLVKALIEKNEHNFANSRFRQLEMLRDAIERDRGSFLGRIAVSAGADGRKADRSRATFLSQFQALVIAIG